MIRTKIIIAVLVIVLIGILASFIKKDDKTDVKNTSTKTEEKLNKKDFALDNTSCDKNMYLFEAVPHLASYKGYNLENVGCADMTIVVKYNHPTGKNYELQAILYREIGENKFMHKIAEMGSGLTKVVKVNGSDLSNLSKFENTTINIENTPEYYDIRYIATYKDEYTLGLTLRGADLADKEKVDAFLKTYIESFDLSKLQ
jgi:hypothetical protein